MDSPDDSELQKWKEKFQLETICYSNEDCKALLIVLNDYNQILPPGTC
jgi:hypothetical protein